MVPWFVTVVLGIMGVVIGIGCLLIAEKEKEPGLFRFGVGLIVAVPVVYCALYLLGAFSNTI